MNGTDSQERVFIRKSLRFTEYGLFIAILITLVLKLRLIFLLNIDVDEFTFLSLVHRYLQDILLSPFFTFHVHFFSWLPIVSGNEVTQIFAARTVMYGLSLGSCFFLYLIGRLFLNRMGALFSVLCYLSISNVIVHGASFRFDPMCVFLFLCAFYFLLRKPRSLSTVTIAGLSMALSLMISLKTILYIPTIGAIFLLQLFFKENKKGIEILLFTVTLVIGFVLLYYYHLSTLAKSIASPTKVVNNLTSQGIFVKEIFPNFIYMVMIIKENLIVWVYWVAGITLLVWDLLYNKERSLFEGLLLLSFLIPLFSLVFYKYNFPYFYVFVLSPSIIFPGVLISKISEDFGKKGSISFLLLICIFSLTVLGNFILHFKRNNFDQTIAQKEIVKLVHKMFPEPVPYIDRCSMISSYPKVGLRMTTKDMERYINVNKPVMRNVLYKYRPVFIVSNSVHLDLSVPRGSRRDIFKNYPLLEEDYNILKKNFIHQWGPIYVAGKHLNFNPIKKSQTIDILIPGNYTLESDGEVSINGAIHRPGDKIFFKQMTYTVVPKTIPLKMTLRWGKDLYKPSQKPSAQPIFLGYYLQALKMGH